MATFEIVLKIPVLPLINWVEFFSYFSYFLTILTGILAFSTLCSYFFIKKEDVLEEFPAFALLSVPLVLFYIVIVEGFGYKLVKKERFDEYLKTRKNIWGDSSSVSS